MRSTTTLLPTLPTHPFWSFSVQIYEQEANQHILLNLQNRYGLNVNVLLFCCWYAATNQGQLSKQEIKQILTSIHHWHERIINALRSFRDRLKEEPQSWAQTIRKEILSAELTAEHIEQLIISECLTKKPPRNRRTSQQQAANACHNIANYCSVVYINLDQNDCEAIASLLNHIFFDLSAKEALNFSNSILASKLNQKKSVFKQLQLKLP